MPAKRMFSDEQLKKMGQRNVDAIIEAIEAGDLAQAKDIAQRMHRECLAMHDGLIEWITALLSFIGRRYGDEALCEALREGCTTWLRPLTDRVAQAENAGHRAAMLVKMLRGHMMPIRIEEDDQKFTFVMEPCGSGGRLILDGKYGPPRNFWKIQKPQPMTCGQKDLPVYCAHAAVVSMLGIEWTGAPLFFEEPSDEVGNKPCKIYVYKDTKAVPSELYNKVGKVKKRVASSNRAGDA